MPDSPAAARWLDDTSAARGAAAWVRSRNSAPSCTSTARDFRRGAPGLSESKLEELNSRLAPVNNRASGFHSVEAFIAMVLLCVGGFSPILPHL